MKALPIIIIVLGVILTLFAPYAFTQCSSGVNFGDPNEIGDTLGGTTAPIIGIMGALLVYLTFEQQNKAIQQPIELEKEKIQQSRRLILLDIRTNILPDANRFLTDSIEFRTIVNSQNRDIILASITYLGLSTDIYKAFKAERLFEAFGENLFVIARIYRNVDFLSKQILTDIYRTFNEVENMPNIRPDLFQKKNDAYNATMTSLELSIRNLIADCELILSQNI